MRNANPHSEHILETVSLPSYGNYIAGSAAGRSEGVHLSQIRREDIPQHRPSGCAIMKFPYQCAMGVLATAIAAAIPQSVFAGSLLMNGGFDTPTPGLSPPNYPTAISGAGAAGVSSAEFWTLFNNFNATTSTELLPSTDPFGSGSMIHLSSVTNTSDPDGSFFNGLQQGFGVVPGASASVDVFALSGPVILALYTGNGSTLLDFTQSSTTDQWETLTVTSPVGTDPNLVIIYSYSTSGTGEFYADNAAVMATVVPEPSTGILVLLGLPLAIFCRRKPRLRNCA